MSCERRGCRPYLQGGRVRNKAMDVDIDLPHHEDLTPTHGYAVTRKAAMAAFAMFAAQVSDIRNHSGTCSSDPSPPADCGDIRAVTLRL
jgi:hypothetical protein